jgi:anti-sigma B factor antagonist
MTKLEEAPHLGIGVQDLPEVTTIALTGDLDLGDLPALRATFAAADASACPLVLLDLRNLQFIGACGLGAIAHAAARLRAQGRQLRLIEPSPFIRGLLRLTGLDTLIDDAAVPVTDRTTNRPPVSQQCSVASRRGRTVARLCSARSAAAGPDFLVGQGPNGTKDEVPSGPS